MNIRVLAEAPDGFLDRVADRTCVVGVIGLGYVGIPLAQRISQTGLKSVGFDVCDQRVQQLNSGFSPLKHIGHDQIATMVESGFEAVAEFSRISECDALVICVPTPVDASRTPDLSRVVSVMEAIRPHLRHGQLISLESTTWPGTTEEVLRPLIENEGLVVGQDIFLTYSPEREDPGNRAFETRTIPKVIGGATPACLEAGLTFYRHFIDEMVPTSSTRTAEMVKLLENIHRSVNIALVNEMKVVADKMGLDIFEIIDAAATKPFGFRAYYPGPGIGGHCIPVDPFYLSWKARQYGVTTRFIDLAGDVNAEMPNYVIGRLAEALNSKGRAVRGSRVLVLGVAYKPDVDDLRESPALDIIKGLERQGANISICDPMIRKWDAPLSEYAVDFGPVTLANQDAVILVTDHSAFDYEMISNRADLVIDCRGRIDASAPHVTRA